MRYHHGYTTIDVIAACVLVLGAIVIAALLLSNPAAELEHQYDVVRSDDVRDLMEVMLELEVEEPQTFWSIVDDVRGEAAMIGTAATCGDDYTVDACSASMDCLNLFTLSSEYLESLPVDPNDERFSYDRTGYYLLYEDDVLEIGACAPESVDAISLLAYVPEPEEE